MAGSGSIAALGAPPIRAAAAALFATPVGGTAIEALAATLSDPQGQGVVAAAKRGREVVLEGYLAPARGGSHYAVFAPTPAAADPCVNDCRAWPRDHVRVYAAPGAGLPAAGKVRLRGRLFEGKFVDVPSGHAARRVLVNGIPA